MHQRPIVVVGSLNLDLVVHAARIPLAGETLAGTGYSEFPGGKGANQAVAAARLGSPVKMIGSIGSDGYGVHLLESLRQAGVESSNVRTLPGASGVAIITHAEDGANTIVVIPGANALLDVQAVHETKAILESASALLLQLEVPMPTVVLAAQLAAAARVPVILDPAPVADLPDDLLRVTTWITPNQTEAARLLNQPEDHDLEQTADRLLAMGVRNVALKLGADGAYLKGADCPEGLRVPSYTVHAVDTTAAGDCFNAAFATQLANGHSAAAAARYANAAAAISVTRSGAQPSMPTQQEVAAALEQWEATRS